MPIPLVPKLYTFRFWASLTWLILSAVFVPPANAAYGQVPPVFVEDRGLAREPARFILQGPGVSGLFEPRQVTVTMGQSTFRVTFPGQAPAVGPAGLNVLPGRVNFLFGEPSDWKTDLPTYGSITYRDIFRGIDLNYSVSRTRLKSEFVVRPGADASLIRLEYHGAEALQLKDGALVLRIAGGEFHEEPPLLYQEIQGRRELVSGGFRLLDDRTVGFWTGDYDHDEPLTIDPVLSYSTYLGGGGMDAVTSIAVDGAGNSYLAGWTASTDLPTVNPARAQNGGGVDAFIAKLGPGGNNLIYCTYLGGRGDDRAFGVAVDSSGNAYVTGWTSSSAFPTVAPLQSALNGTRDAFVAKLNPAGNALVYSTFLGGSANDSGNAIAVDAAGNAYVTGDTYSTNFPTRGPYQPSIRGQQNTFVAKLGTSGSLIYSTYLGGNGTDHAAGIAVDTAGNAYVTGGTTSTNFPTASPLQAASGGSQDAFVTKLNASGNALVYSTYLGGSGGAAGSLEAGSGIAVDATGAAYIAGSTSSSNFPVTAGAVQSTYSGGGDDAFVTKLNPAGSALLYSTYLGGSSVDYATGIAVDFLGNAYVTGYTASSDFWSLRAVQAGNAGFYDAFVSKLSPAGALLSSTFLGGSSSDSANALAVDTLGNVFLAGQTQSMDFPIQTAFQNVNGGSYGGFITKISPGWTAAVFSNGAWYVDRNHTGGFDGTSAGDQAFTFGQAGDIPVAGDWSGSGTLKIGVFRNGQWLLDYNGNGVWDGVAGGDRLYNFGQAGDKPVTGDWTGTGTTKIGVFRGGYWMLDWNGNGQWDGAGTGDSGFWFGNSAYIPVVGDWSGSGTTKAGLFINGTWYLDLNGDGQWSGSDPVYYYGQAGDLPVAGDWSGSGKTGIGVFRNGYWILDMNGNGALDGVGIGEAAFWFGNSSFAPVVLR